MIMNIKCVMIMVCMIVITTIIMIKLLTMPMTMMAMPTAMVTASRVVNTIQTRSGRQVAGVKTADQLRFVGRGGSAPVTSNDLTQDVRRRVHSGTSQSPAQQFNSATRRSTRRSMVSRSAPRTTCCQLRLILVTFNGHAEGL